MDSEGPKLRLLGFQRTLLQKLRLYSFPFPIFFEVLFYLINLINKSNQIVFLLPDLLYYLYYCYSMTQSNSNLKILLEKNWETFIERTMTFLHSYAVLFREKIFSNCSISKNVKYAT